MGSNLGTEDVIECQPLILNGGGVYDEYSDADLEQVRPFVWSEYAAFFTIGLSMMWTWSMILQAIPYFKQQFTGDDWILRNFQAFHLMFFAFTMMLVTAIINIRCDRPYYAARLRGSLFAYLVVAILLVFSTIEELQVGPRQYFAFTLAMVTFTSIANSLSQNSAFAFAANFGRTEYGPAIMTGEAVAGLLPSTIEIITALASPVSNLRTGPSDIQPPPTVLPYFSSAVVVALASLSALAYLRRRASVLTGAEKYSISHRHWEMAKRLKWPALANFSCLCISSVTPVFVAKITSVVPLGAASVLLQPHAFIPMAIVLWNLGDLMGSILAVASKFLISHPRLIFALSFARIGFIPIYLRCNIDGRGSFAGDWFYLGVQVLFGTTHGWLSGTSMMGVPEWVEPADREDAGAFMGMTLVTGLVAGSVLGLVAAQV
ncbi:nucleoside transporter [Cadophora sp. MPI-SDFR-AT-0126]|nr:nucleoside transporter [Leotiomycetes sp. MPI-SDFR-AT-0126]